MKKTENRTHGLNVTVGGAENRAGETILFRGCLQTAFCTVTDITDVQPTREINILAMPYTVRIAAVDNFPAVPTLAAVAQLNNAGFQLLDHVLTFLDELLDYFKVSVGNTVAHSSPE
jgi:hypothetical protein